jgi:uncharacterized protein (UPF0548 family)
VNPHRSFELLHFRRPTDDRIRRLIASERGLDYTYSERGATAGDPATRHPACYVVDRTRVALGRGRMTFERACAALRQWRQFDLGWLTVAPADAPIAPGSDVVVAARVCGVWATNVARIVYVVDEPRRFGFAYGTLPGHMAIGEERFLIDWDDADEVYYDVLAFSRPRHPLMKLGYPLVRRLQKRFGRESAAAMRRAVEAPTPPE